MIQQPKSRNRLSGRYEENMAGMAGDYLQQRRRLLDLSLASIRNARAIDDLMQRLQPAWRSSPKH